MRRLVPALLVPIAIVAALLLAYRVGWRGDAQPLVVYCAHDVMFSRQILGKFERETGIKVDPHFDNEATKSLGLTRKIIEEKDHPRCDVFWNNQWLGTADLAERGLLEPYKGPGYRRIPDRYKDPAGRFAGFAARLRVYIVNTDGLRPDPLVIEQILLASDLSRVAMARPLFGTTLTHFTVLWHQMGERGMKAWWRDWNDRHVTVRGGNATVKNLVAGGECDLGFTDTDDYFVARDAGKPVELLPVRVGEDDSVICIPNTVAIIKGTDRYEDAARLVDFLLSKQAELLLARSPARQIPLGPVDESLLSDDVRRLRRWARDSHALSGLVEARRSVLAWLQLENGG